MTPSHQTGAVDRRPPRRPSRGLKCYVVAAFLLLPFKVYAQVRYDVVILGGRVVDPASGMDAVRNIGIQNGRIVAISQEQLQGSESINASGLVVAPGFIDLHEHAQTDEAYRAKVLDGVTTALEMEAGVPDIDQFYAERKGKALINFGATIGHEYQRAAVVTHQEAKEPTGRAATDSLSLAEIEELRKRIER